jgi:phospholipase C
MTRGCLRRAAVASQVAAALLLFHCDAQQPSFGYKEIDNLKTPPDPPLRCGVDVSATRNEDERSACKYGAGAMASDTLGIPAGTLEATPIRHVIVMMKENRSFDHLLGQLNARGQPGTEPIPASYTNPDLNGNAVAPFHQTNTCVPDDPLHQSASNEICIDGGRMDGFVRNAAQSTSTDGHFAIGYYDQPDLPFYYFLAATYAINDRHFAPMASGTYANRNFLLFGSNAGVVDTGIDYPAPDTPSIMQTLMNAGFTWGAYTDDQPFAGALDWAPNGSGLHTMQDLYDALDNGTLPNVAFVDGKENIEDDHPDADVQAGEAWSKVIYDHMVRSPQWMRIAMIWTYDECGAFADHVPPDPPGCQAAPDSPFTERGPRIPLVVISPWARRNFVSHVPEDHTAITRFIEAIFGLPALTARDANSSALLDLFDFSCSHDLSIPSAPAAGTGECTNPAPPGTD